jgi:hypothetical protein
MRASRRAEKAARTRARNDQRGRREPREGAEAKKEARADRSLTARALPAGLPPRARARAAATLAEVNTGAPVLETADPDVFGLLTREPFEDGAVVVLVRGEEPPRRGVACEVHEIGAGYYSFALEKE